MSQGKAALLMMKGAISDLSEEDQAAVAKAREALMLERDKHGEAGTVAFQLMCVEMAAEE